jgi:predicted RNA-binding protein with PUA-like domain
MWWDMSESQSLKGRKAIDPLRDRRSGNDRRKVHDLDFFKRGGIDRRSGVVSRQKDGHGDQSIDDSQAPAYLPKQDHQSNEWLMSLRCSRANLPVI